MIKRATQKELKVQYLRAQNQVSSGVRSPLCGLKEFRRRKNALIGENGRELLRRLDFVKKLPHSAFAYKPPEMDEIRSRVEIATTVYGSHRSGWRSPLVIYLEADNYYIGYENEEIGASLGAQLREREEGNPLTLLNFIVRERRDKDGLWIVKAVDTVMREALAFRASPKLRTKNQTNTPHV